MTKTAAQVTLSPLKFVPTSPILKDDLAQVLKASNYAAANNPEVHGAHFPALVIPFTLPVGVGVTNPLWTPTINQIYADNADGTLYVRHDWWMRLDPDVVSLRFYAECNVPVSGDSISVALQIGATTYSLAAFVNSDNGTYKSMSFSATAIAGGEVRVQVLVGSPVGTSTYTSAAGPCLMPWLVWWSLQEELIDPSTFPAPSETITIIEG